MAPPPTPFINAQAVSGITGSISIACWIIVFAPQIYQNFTRRSAEGLSLLFVVLWLLGDVFNVIGAILQGVLPTMTILAIYYTIADIVLFWQCLHYGHGSNKVDPIHLSPANPLNSEVEPLLESVLSNEHYHHHHQHHEFDPDSESQVVMDSNIIEHPTSYSDINGSNPESNTRTDSSNNIEDDECSSCTSSSSFEGSDLTYNLIMVSLVIIAGLGGWYFGDSGSSNEPPKNDDDLIFNPLAQTFGWLCAALYLGSRIPQILLNFERKSCDGISFLFFLFACLGNITYVVSILAVCTGKRYLLVNSSWLIGSFGTLFEDFIIFCQFFMYNKNGAESDEDIETEDEEDNFISNV
ncbi:hypothetical protein C6P40_002043 [Pichia californica]|uniref:PQ-loop-domain-containing protein n=1 Tax=Pichia californica TaxID=460514 RepID=A0A9P6WIY0_9ASCO|nr:hypothetical protein C6P42_002053 [[Candida] californica]KAG0687674.1 hypothetical protein C6P40_002043 [[Candida] californica]